MTDQTAMLSRTISRRATKSFDNSPRRPRHIHWWLAAGLGFGIACDPQAGPEELEEEDEEAAAEDESGEFRGHPGRKPGAVAMLGREIAVVDHLEDGEEFLVPRRKLIDHGKALFGAKWTTQEGGGRPLTTGVGAPLVDPTHPLVFPRNFNRVSAPDSNACTSCHNAPFAGGGGDFVANAFVTAQRFDFATFDATDIFPIRGAVDELGNAVTLQDIGNERNTLGMFGAGYIEMLAREMTEELQEIRDGLAPGQSAPLEAKGVSFGTLARGPDGSWDVSGVEGLTVSSLSSSGPDEPPSLVIRPFHQSSAVVSLREFTNNAFNHHHGIQSTERFGFDTDPDGDGFTNELTVADVTAVAVFQATLPVPGHVIPDNPVIEAAIYNGAERFLAVGCADCHRPSLTLERGESLYSEPNPYNPPGNLQEGTILPLVLDLNDPSLPPPRLRAHGGKTRVWAFTDLKLHDITTGPNDPNRDPIDLQHPAGSDAFFAGTGQFLTRKLWGVASEAPFFHHGRYTTMRQAIEAHAGEAELARAGFDALSDHDKNSIIEFLKTFQILPPGTRHRVVNEKFEKKKRVRSVYWLD